MSACTVQITSYGRSNRWQEACRFFQEMPSKSLEPNTISGLDELVTCEDLPRLYIVSFRPRH